MMKVIVNYILLMTIVFFSSELLALTCPSRVICNAHYIGSCFPYGGTSVPICNAYRKHSCWKMEKQEYGALSESNVSDRPPLNDMCYYLNDCGFYSVILDYQGEGKFGL